MIQKRSANDTGTLAERYRRPQQTITGSIAEHAMRALPAHAYRPNEGKRVPHVLYNKKGIPTACAVQ